MCCNVEAKHKRTLRSHIKHKKLFNPLSAKVVHDRHDADVAAAVAPRTGKIIKNVFLKEEKICYKMVY